MHIFLTIMAGFLASCAAVAAFVALRMANEACAARDELQSGMRKLVATREEILVLEKRLDRLAGRVYAQSRRPITDEQVAGQVADDVRAAGNGALPIDDDLQAMLALQSAPSPKPGT